MCSGNVSKKSWGGESHISLIAYRLAQFLRRPSLQLIALQTTKSRMKEVRGKQFAVGFKGERESPIGIIRERKKRASV